MTVNYYEILEVGSKASKEEIKAAYRRKIKEFHPDTHQGDENALEMTMQINEANRILNDPVKRAQYDDLLKLYEEQKTEPNRIRENAEEGEVAHYSCESCGRQDHTLRVSVFLYVVSLLIVTYRKPSVKILCSKCRIMYSVVSSIETFLLGWWAFPYGIIYTVEALSKNMEGGIQPSENNFVLLQAVAHNLYDQSEYYESYKALRECLKLKYDENIERFAVFVKTLIPSDSAAVRNRWRFESSHVNQPERNAVIWSHLFPDWFLVEFPSTVSSVSDVLEAFGTDETDNFNPQFVRIVSDGWERIDKENLTTFPRETLDRLIEYYNKPS